MRKLMTALAVLALAATTFVVGAGAAGADAHNQKSCEAAGGEWTNVQGSKSCVYPEETEEGKNDRFTCTTQETETGQGNLKNKGSSSTEQTDSEGTGSGKCPPGQFN